VPVTPLPAPPHLAVPAPLDTYPARWGRTPCRQHASRRTADALGVPGAGDM